MDLWQQSHRTPFVRTYQDIARAPLHDALAIIDPFQYPRKDHGPFSEYTLDGSLCRALQRG